MKNLTDEQQTELNNTIERMLPSSAKKGEPLNKEERHIISRILTVAKYRIRHADEDRYKNDVVFSIAFRSFDDAHVLLQVL